MPSFISIFLGAGYDCLLFVLGFLAAGGGHGTYVLLGLSSSPFPLLGTLPGEAANRRFQFSLRRLLLAITLIATALACLLKDSTSIQAVGVALASIAAIIFVGRPSRATA